MVLKSCSFLRELYRLAKVDRGKEHSLFCKCTGALLNSMQLGEPYSVLDWLLLFLASLTAICLFKG